MTQTFRSIASRAFFDGGPARLAQVTFDVSRCLAEINRWTTRPLDVTLASFSLIAYNARDMNLNYIYLSLKDSRNLFKVNPPDSPCAIPHFIHRGGSCGYPGGCNNASPYTPEISDIEIERLDAQAVIWLWRQKPVSIEQPPDMTFVINFR